MKLGCIDDDRNVGSWTEESPGLWVRKGPRGYRNLFGDEVAYVTFRNFGAYTTDGLGEESGHVWGDTSRMSSSDVDESLARMRDEMDATLRGFGWIVDGKGYVSPSLWQRIKGLFT